MKLSEFDYTLPPEKIAQTPAEPRDSSKLLILDTDTWNIQDTRFFEIENYLWPNDVLVVNATKVIKARLKGKIWERQVEIFLHKQISQDTWDCLVYPGKKLKPWKEIVFYQKKDSESPSMEHSSSEWQSILLKATIEKISEKWRIVQFWWYKNSFFETLDELGEIPLPPYIKEKSPDERYQTVYNNEVWGSVAAPTAGLHFTPELLKKLEKKWVCIEKVILHVGLGTFMNVETENIEDHSMHSEFISLDEKTSQRLNDYKTWGKRIIAVGTTSIRVLESFSDDSGHLWHGTMDTDIFIYPGYKWKFVESLITNFHLPKSTLLMLVSSLAGKENIKNVYRHAIDNNYRFFSFGDAMWIERRKDWKSER